MKKALTASAIFAMALSVFAGAMNIPQGKKGFKTLEGKHYKNVEVLSISPAWLEMEFDGGIKRIYFKDLPENIQKEFGYNAKRAKRYMEHVKKSRKNWRKYVEKRVEKEAEARAMAEKAADKFENAYNKRSEGQDASREKSIEARNKKVASGNTLSGYEPYHYGSSVSKDKDNNTHYHHHHHHYHNNDNDNDAIFN